jgi:hypothetical protein
MSNFQVFKRRQKTGPACLHPEEDGRREKKDFLKVIGNQVIIASLDSTGLFLQIKINFDNMTVTYLLINPAISRLLF